MLTRLKVSGFKNLVDVDVRFGPFTCIAGANGSGKSNLFDAIRFLSALAERPLLEAAQSVRTEDERNTDIRNLFHRVGEQYAPEMSFEAEMIIPEQGLDDLNQRARASITFVRYSLALAYRVDDGLRSLGSLEVLSEELGYINPTKADEHLLFPHTPSTWRKSAIKGRRTAPFISTEIENNNRVVKLHQEGSAGRARKYLASNLPRTVLSSTNAAENPTALLTRREMQSWILLQLEPSSLRRPDRFTSASNLGSDGSHLPATLSRLARLSTNHRAQDDGSSQVFAQLSSRLAQLIDDVDDVWVERDEIQQLLTLYVTDRSGTSYPAQSLSDGTLRFLALAVLELDPQAQGVICLEEPENGIHPGRIPAILELLQDIAADVHEIVDDSNPLRQVIINTHSPAVVLQVPEDSLVVARLKEKVQDGQRFSRASFGSLSGTWRVNAGMNVISKGELLSYLNPVRQREPEESHLPKRVADRPDIQQLMLPLPEDIG
jgi:predicted ATPase